MEKKRTPLLIVNILIVLLTVLGVCITQLVRSDGLLIAEGLHNLKYFTVLSNILEGIASLVLAVRLIRLRRGRADGIPHWMYVLKLVSASAVAVTFFVVALFFGPWVGYGLLYRDANLFFHLVIPVLAMGEFVALDRFDSVTLGETALCAAPELLYGLGYLLNLLINGIGVWPDTNDFYGFTTWGWGVGFMIFAAILLLGWGAGCLLRLGSRAGRSEKTKS